VKTFQEVYGQRLGCLVDSLSLVSGNPSQEEIRDKIAAADMVYLGGGNTSTLLSTLALRGVSPLLIEAGHAGTTLAGLSAGAICWFQWASSHADMSPHPAHRGHGRYRGLGLLPGTCAPHFGQQIWRWQVLRTLLKRERSVGIGLDDLLALEVLGDRYRILATRPDRSLKLLDFRGAEGRLEVHPPHEEWKPLTRLFGPN
jgi:dipeptidase E